MECALCHQQTSELINIQGNDVFINNMHVIFDQRHQTFPDISNPVLICMDCIDEANTQESLEDVVESPTLHSHPDIMTDSDSSHSESTVITTEGLPLSESLNGPPNNSLPIISQPPTLSQQSQQNDSEFAVPMTPRKLAQLNAIRSKPGPKAIKRRREQEFIREIQESRLSEVVSQSPEEDEIARLIIANEPKPRPRPAKRTKINKSNSSSSSNENSLQLSSQSINAEYLNPRQLPVSSQEDISPRSQRVLRSPIIDPNGNIRVTHRHRSESLSSNESNPAPRTVSNRPQAAANPKVPSRNLPPTPDNSPPIPAAVQRVAPPPARVAPPAARVPPPAARMSPPPARVAPPPARNTDDGNRHTNMGAPRRINFPSEADTSRSVRGAKLTSGG